MNLAEPVGSQMTMWGRTGTIVGVVKDYHHVSLHREIMPHVFNINPRSYRALKYLFVKLNNTDLQASLTGIRETVNRFAPGEPFAFEFLDQDLENLYRTDVRLGEIIGVFALLAVFISCLGIFGLAAFTAEQRTKEIGIRKVCGASLPRLAGLLSSWVTRWVLLANVLAWPLAWFVMNRWLEEFAYRTDVGTAVFILAGILSLAVALGTISYPVLRTATSNPVDSLRHE
jgi:putative ABC transport system permease protein